MKIIIRGTVSAGKTLLAQSIQRRAEAAGKTVFISDHSVHSWKSSFMSDLAQAIVDREDSGADVGIITINTGTGDFALSVEFHSEIGPDDADWLF